MHTLPVSPPESPLLRVVACVVGQVLKVVEQFDLAIDDSDCWAFDDLT